MGKIKYLVLAGSIMLLSAFTIQKSIDLKISDNYSIKLSGNGVKGIFKTLSGEVSFDENDLASSIFNFKVDVNSINTGNGIKNKHAKSRKWFNTANYPYIYFISNKVVKIDKGYSVTGEMEIHGVKKEMIIPFTYEDNVFKSNFSVNRIDFMVGKMTGMMKKVSNEIKIEVLIPVTKK